jgi:hypothetical protein
MICVCWHAYVLEILTNGTHFALPEADPMHQNYLKHIIATKKKSTSFDSTRRGVGACSFTGGLAPNRTGRLST